MVKYIINGLKRQKKPLTVQKSLIVQPFTVYFRINGPQRQKKC